MEEEEALLARLEDVGVDAGLPTIILLRRGRDVIYNKMKRVECRTASKNQSRLRF
jgi:hypothetical protein